MVDILTPETSWILTNSVRKVLRIVRIIVVIVLSVIGFVINTPSFGGTIQARQSALDAFFVAIFIAAAMAVLGEIVWARREPPKQLGVVLVALVFGFGMLCLAGVFNGIAVFDLFGEGYRSRFADITSLLVQYLLFMTWEGEAVTLFLRLRKAGVSLEKVENAGKR